MTQAHPLLAQLDEVSGSVGDLLAGVDDDAWTRRTPCPDWNVRQLVGHLVAGNHKFAAAAQGADFDPPASVDAAAGDDPTASFTASAATLIEAMNGPGALERTYASPVGTVPGPVLIHLRMVEYLVHGWDLARATGRPLQVDEGLVAQEFEFTRTSLDNVEGARRPFALPQPVSPDAPVLDRLAALLGRDVEDA